LGSGAALVMLENDRVGAGLACTACAPARKLPVAETRRRASEKALTLGANICFSEKGRILARRLHHPLAASAIKRSKAATAI